MRGNELYRKAKRLIPGGTQLLSKDPDRFVPDGWPTYYSRAKGQQVWDLEGVRYTDMSMHGIGTCVIGYADNDVDGAVKKSIRMGVASTLNCPEEVELAERLLRLHPWAGGVRYARTGGEAMAIAVRIARAHTGMDRIAFCGYHGWHDWYLAANLANERALDGHLLPGLPPAGVPRALAGSAVPFRFGDLETLEDALGRADVAAVVMEPVRDRYPPNGYLGRVKRIAHKYGAVLVFDEITAGLRISPGGAHLALGVTPDLATFAKGLGNGYAMAAVVGRSGVMQSAQRSFISSTNWTERIGPTAAIATLEKFEDLRGHTRLIELGRMVQGAWGKAAEEAGLAITTSGIEPLSHFSIDRGGEAAHTYFSQRMLNGGFLATNAFYASLSHTEEAIDRYGLACNLIFKEIVRHLDENSLLKALQKKVRHSGFARLTD